VDRNRRSHTSCRHLWFITGPHQTATPSIYCEVDDKVIDTMDVDECKCKHFNPPPEDYPGEGKPGIEWFNKYFKEFKSGDDVSDRLAKNPDGSRLYLTEEYFALCKSYEEDR